jgi:hypothetical protein
MIAEKETSAMAAKGKTELLDITHKEFAKLLKLVDSLAQSTAMQKDENNTSIKDVVGHRAHWIELFLGWYADGLAGKTVSFPAEGYKWNDLKRYNANLREQQSEMSWEEAVELLRDNNRQLIGFIESSSDQELYGGPMKGANNQWTAGRWAEAAGPSHFRSAAKYIRAALKAAQ